MASLTTTDLAKRAGISKSYACEILGGVRNPSRPLAIHIFRQTGWKHDLIGALDESQMAMLEQIEPWKGKAA